MLVPARRNKGFLDDFMMNPFDAFFDAPQAARPAPGLLKTDVRETDKGFRLNIDMPGIQKEDAKVDLKDGYLKISATTQSSNEEEAENGSFIRKERFEGSCSRSFYVGEDIDEDAIKASFENGVLVIDVPKKEKEKIEESGKSIAIS